MTGPGDDQSADRPGAPPRGRRRGLLALAAVALALGAGIPLLVNALDDDGDSGPSRGVDATVAVGPPSSSTPSPDVDVRTVITSWARADLPRGAAVLTDTATGRALRSAGFTDVHGFGGATARDLKGTDYVVDVAGASVADAAGRRSALAYSTPLAIFGSDAAPSTVRAVFHDSTSAARRHRAAADALQREGGRELLANPAVVADRAVRTVLDRGHLDLRAQNVLTELASAGSVDVSDPDQNRAEQRAGLPVRTIVVTVDDPSATTSALAAMSDPYRPAAVRRHGPGALQLTWRPELPTARVVGG